MKSFKKKCLPSFSRLYSDKNIFLEKQASIVQLCVSFVFEWLEHYNFLVKRKSKSKIFVITFINNIQKQTVGM